MQFKNLYIVHYHFNKGGVSNVIERSVHAILRSKSMTFQSIQLVGGSKQRSIFQNADSKPSTKPTNSTKPTGTTDPTVKAIHAPMFAYQEHCEQVQRYHINRYPSKKLQEGQIRKDIAAFFETHHAEQNLWWVHNYHLGKNPLFTKELLRFIQKRNPHIILQIHDFPEQARYPQLKTLLRVVGKGLYTFNTKTRIAVINEYDKEILRKSGVKAFVIPNIVSKLQVKKKTGTDAAFKTYLHKEQKNLRLKDNSFFLFTYPVRCIRRKNVFESMLFAKLLESFSSVPCVLNITLPGESKFEKRYTARGQALAAKGFSRTAFSLGADPSCPFSFEAMCHASDMIVSSSVLEGFGYTYLESLLFKKPLLARSINQNKRIRTMLGLHWPSVWYQKLAIPRSIIEDLHHKHHAPSLSSLYQKKIDALKVFLSKEEQDAVRGIAEDKLKQKSIDFSLLPLETQEQIIKDYASHEKALLMANKGIVQQSYAVLLAQKALPRSPKSREKFREESREKTKVIFDLVEKAYGEEAFLRVFGTILHDFSRKSHQPATAAATAPSSTVSSIIRLHGTLENLRPLFDSL